MTNIPDGFMLSKDGKLWLPGDAFYRHTWQLAERLKHDHADRPFLFCLARGGYAVGSVVGNCFARNDIHSIAAISYKGERQTDIRFPGAIPVEAIKNRGADCLFLDDLFDSGKTARSLKNALPEAAFAAVYTKPAGQDVADCFHMEIPDRWVVFPWEESWDSFVPA